MTKFSRSSSWLKGLFTPSQSKFPNPGILSDEVSLVQPYDGSGWPLWDPDQWFLSITSATIAAAATTLLTVPDDFVARILAVSARTTAGVAPSARIFVGGPLINVGLGDLQLLTATPQVMPVQSPIIAPGHRLRGDHVAGDAATIVIYSVYFVQAPMGSVFYI